MMKESDTPEPEPEKPVPEVAGAGIAADLAAEIPGVMVATEMVGGAT